MITLPQNLPAHCHSFSPRTERAAGGVPRAGEVPGHPCVAVLVAQLWDSFVLEGLGKCVDSGWGGAGPAAAGPSRPRFGRRRRRTATGPGFCQEHLSNTGQRASNPSIGGCNAARATDPA